MCVPKHCSYFRQSGVDVLIRDLEVLWETFKTSISNSNIRDYLSLEHLGIILKHLASKGNHLC